MILEFLLKEDMILNPDIRSHNFFFVIYKSHFDYPAGGWLRKFRIRNGDFPRFAFAFGVVGQNTPPNCAAAETTSVKPSGTKTRNKMQSTRINPLRNWCIARQNENVASNTAARKYQFGFIITP